MADSGDKPGAGGLIDDSIRLSLLYLLLRPVMKFCLRHSLKLQEIIEACKITLLEVAAQELSASGKGITAGKLNIMTGVHRPDVQRLYKRSDHVKPLENIISRVVGQWQSDHRFTTPAGRRPRDLSISGKKSEFAKLVAAVSGDLNPYTVLFELERTGLIERKEDKVRLNSHVTVVSGNVETGFRLLSQDGDDLIRSVEENMLNPPSPRNLHGRTEYTSISVKYVDQIREWFLKEGAAFHARARKFLSRYDKDINRRISSADGEVRVTVCTFSRIDKEGY